MLNKLKLHQHYLNCSINKGASIPMFTEEVLNFYTMYRKFVNDCIEQDLMKF